MVYLVIFQKHKDPKVLGQRSIFPEFQEKVVVDYTQIYTVDLD